MATRHDRPPGDTGSFIPWFPDPPPMQRPAPGLGCALCGGPIPTNRSTMRSFVCTPCQHALTEERLGHAGWLRPNLLPTPRQMRSLGVGVLAAA